jgi:hypothetical protein
MLFRIYGYCLGQKQEERDPYGGTHLASCLRIWSPVLLALFFIELVNQLLNQFVHLVLDPFPFGSVALDRANVHG